jgi:hypothetical protein
VDLVEAQPNAGAIFRHHSRIPRPVGRLPPTFETARKIMSSVQSTSSPNSWRTVNRRRRLGPFHPKGSSSTGIVNVCDGCPALRVIRLVNCPTTLPASAAAA